MTQEISPTSDEILNFIRELKPYLTEHPLIRIGPNHDSGYLLPNDLLGIKNCYSAGVGISSDFEIGLANRKIRSFMADASVEGPILPSNTPDSFLSYFVFDKKFVGLTDSGDYITLKTWVNNYTPNDNNLILQMDIEGGEYEVIQSTPNDIFDKFRIIVIEFHHLQLLWDRESFENLKVFFGKILKNFTVVHLHPNNNVAPFIKDGISIPPVLEITFIRNDRVTQKTPAKTFPHQLDFESAANLPSFPLPQEWYSS